VSVEHSHATAVVSIYLIGLQGSRNGLWDIFIKKPVSYVTGALGA